MAARLSSASVLVALAALFQLTSAHLVLTYPGWRGDNLATNGTVGVDDYDKDLFPYGMQWNYPCGGTPWNANLNRTYWPINGGAVSFEPGWFQGHKQALIYINLGLGTRPGNYSLVMQPMFQIVGPTNDAYPGLGICMPQVPLPANVTVKEGDNATIQVVEAAKHGAALYSCVDITFTNDYSKIKPINESNCRNDSKSIQFTQLFSTADVKSGALPSALRNPTSYGLLATAVLASIAWFAS